MRMRKAAWLLMVAMLLCPVMLQAHGGGGSGLECSCSCGGMIIFGGGCTASGPCPCTCTCGIFSDRCSCGSVNMEQLPA
jgi:hypothetical protein